MPAQIFFFPFFLVPEFRVRSAAVDAFIYRNERIRSRVTHLISASTNIDEDMESAPSFSSCGYHYGGIEQRGRSLPPGDKLSITRLASKSPFVPSESPAGDANGESDDEAIIPKHVFNRERKEGFLLLLLLFFLPPSPLPLAKSERFKTKKLTDANKITSPHNHTTSFTTRLG